MIQLQLIEPQGAAVLELARKHEKDAARARHLAEIYNVRGWGAVASKLFEQASQSEAMAEELNMLAEFEALGGVS